MEAVWGWKERQERKRGRQQPSLRSWECLPAQCTHMPLREMPGGGALERAARLRPPPFLPYQILTAHLGIFKGICWELSTRGRLTFCVLRLCFTCCCCVQRCWRDNRWLLLSVGFQKTSLTPSPRRTFTINGPTSMFAFLSPLRNTLCVMYLTVCLEHTLLCTSVYVQSKIPPAEGEEGVHL